MAEFPLFRILKRSEQKTPDTNITSGIIALSSTLKTEWISANKRITKMVYTIFMIVFFKFRNTEKDITPVIQ